MNSKSILFRTEGTLWPAFERALRSRPDARALSFGTETISRTTYAELYEHVVVVASLLARHGVGPGDRVALYLGNHPAYVVTDLAVMRLGAVKIPLSAMLTVREAAELITRVEATVVVTDRADDLTPLVPGTVVLSLDEVTRPASSGTVDAPPAPATWDPTTPRSSTSPAGPPEPPRASSTRRRACSAISWHIYWLFRIRSA